MSAFFIRRFLKFICLFLIFSLDSIPTEAVEILGCIQANENTFGTKQRTGESVRLPTKTKLTIIERHKNNARIYFNQENIWVKLTDVTQLHISECLNMDNKNISSTPAKRKFDIFVDISLYSGLNSDSFSNVISEVSETDNIGKFSNPIVTQVKKGFGYSVGGCNRLSFGKGSFSWCLGYMEEAFKIITSINPYQPSDNKRLGDLISAETNTKFKSFLIKLNTAYVFPIRPDRSNFGLGIGLRTNYYLSDRYEIEFLAGSVWKNSSTKIMTGPTGLVNHPNINIFYESLGDPRRDILKKTLFNLEISAESDFAFSILLGFL